MFNKFPKRSGIYHIRDNIEKLELQIRLRHVNSLLKLPKFELHKRRNDEEQQTKELPENDVDDDDDDTTKVKVTRIRWQQKLLSPSEQALYKELSNCLTDTQKKYHRLLMDAADAAAEEAEAGEQEKLKARRRSKKAPKAATAPTQADSMYQSKNEVFTYVDEDSFVPPPLTKRERQQRSKTDDEPVAAGVVMMYVYAALNPETQLVTLRWQPQTRTLHIYPDFNSFQDNPYFIEIDTDYRHLYAYAVENNSATRQTATRANDAANYFQMLPPALPTLPPLTHWHAENELATQFAMPPKRTTRISLLFEIREARNFPYDQLHVRYHIRLPPNTLHEQGLLEASTHSSSATTVTGDGRCRFHFGYTWQLTLLCEEDFRSSDRLHIYFELISIDGWGRERNDGYAHYAVCLAGAASASDSSADATAATVVRLQCLRPVDSFWNTLNRHFIGGLRQFDFIRFFTDNAAEDSLHSRYRCRMQSTGQLMLTCQRMSQRNCELLQPCRTTGMTLDDIMLAYREARRRLEAVTL